MTELSSNQPNPARLALATAFLALIALTGCSGSSGSSGGSGKSAALTASDFVGSTGSPSADATPSQAPPPQASPSETSSRFHPPIREREPTPDETLNVSTRIGAPPITQSSTASPAAPASAPPTAPPVILESLVGHVNGRPVFASEILEPLDGRLRALASQTPDRTKWTTEATRAVVQQLRQLIEEELILAEARSSLSPEQKQGLFSFLGRIQEGMVAQEGGSAVAADEAARSANGRTLTQKTRDKLDEILIAEEIRNRVGARVLVTWRQIQLEYERDFDKYNPKPEATFRMIAVPAAKQEAIESVTSRLAAGESFAAVADDPVNTLGKGDASTLSPTFDGDLSAGKFFGNPGLNDAARSLQVGQTAGPIAVDNTIWWVYLASIDRPPGKSLYEAQLEIESALLERRKETELTRYFNRLKARGNFSRVEDMVDRLMAIAIDRYLPKK